MRAYLRLSLRNLNSSLDFADDLTSSALLWKVDITLSIHSYLKRINFVLKDSFLFGYILSHSAF